MSTTRTKDRVAFSAIAALVALVVAQRSNFVHSFVAPSTSHHQQRIPPKPRRFISPACGQPTRVVYHWVPTAFTYTEHSAAIWTPATSTTLASTKTPSDKTSRASVVFQKVVRPYAGLPDIVFLGYLVEYLQDHFEIPDQLPMVYNKQEAQDDDNDDTTRGVVVQWDSPLSPDSSRTCLRVQVVGIFTDDEQKVPNMAMVVVDKDQPSSSSTKHSKFPPMLVDLFADSEKQILKALDRGLDDFMSGKIRSLGKNDDAVTEQQQKTQSLQEGQEAILGELLHDDTRPAVSRTNAEKNGFIEADVVQKNGIDTESVDEKQAKRATRDQREAALKSMNSSSPSPSSSTNEPIEGTGLEFAVQAAKKALAKRQQKKEQELNEFAVQAAKAAAARRSKSKASSTHSSPPAKAKANPQSEGIDPASMDLSTIRPPILDPKVSGVRRSFMTSISNPSDYAKRLKAKDGNRQKASSKKDTSSPKKLKQPGTTSFNATKVSASDEPDSNLSKRKLNLNVQKDAKEQTIGSAVGGEDEQTKMMIKAAEEALSEIEEKGTDMSPEELLESVMQFGEQKEREKTVGDGFVSGAFENAKDLLREQKEKRNDRVRAQSISTGFNGSAPDRLDSLGENVRELTADEELRRMFEAGERLAEGRITRVQTSAEGSSISSSGATGTTEEDIDALISQEKTVSRHARILDDELAELEVRINKSSDEDLDGPAKNPMFDILSGPEVYNPNVDPETAVNWPGAKRGTREIRLPKELDEAVKQARFAAEVLLGLKKVETADGSNKYTIGGRELTSTQVANFQAVVVESVEIGLIDDPLQIKAEASRLQMLLDELWSQPEERFREISSNYKDLLLSDNFAQLLKQRLNEMADRDLDALRRDDDSLETTHARERELLAHLVGYAQLLLKETRALGAELESQQLEVIRSICKVAMDPSHRTEEEAAMALTDAVRDMRPLFDDCFIAYLKYAVAEEEGRLARAGVLDDQEHNQWLFVLKIVQQGVYAEIARGINRYIEHIWYILRMETPTERKMLLEKLVDVMPTLDVRPFVQVVENIVGSLGQAASGDFDGVNPLGEMTNKLLQLHRDVKEILPPERIAEMSKDADEWAARQKERLLEQRNLTRQRLKASQATEHLDAEIESFGRSGEVERFE